MLSTPATVTRSGQRASIEVIREFTKLANIQATQYEQLARTWIRWSREPEIARAAGRAGLPTLDRDSVRGDPDRG